MTRAASCFAYVIASMLVVLVLSDAPRPVILYFAIAHLICQAILIVQFIREP